MPSSTGGRSFRLPPENILNFWFILTHLWQWALYLLPPIGIRHKKFFARSRGGRISRTRSKPRRRREPVPTDPQQLASGTLKRNPTNSTCRDPNSIPHRSGLTKLSPRL